MNYILAVSGGVDSVVLLDMMSKSKHRILVTHVNHGIRSDSDDDERFVEGLAKKYSMPFVSTKLELGQNASEELARKKRYDFLFEQAREHKAVIATAHHLNDLVETVAINMTRGTGWRGLAVLNRENIERPLLHLPKRTLLAYAMKHGLEWVEDSTNSSDAYLRNRLRKKVNEQLQPSDLETVASLRAKQLQLARSIQYESSKLVAGHNESRHFITNIAEPEAIELLGAIIVQFGAERPARPRLKRALLAIKTAKPGTTHNIGDGVSLAFTTRKFHISVV